MEGHGVISGDAHPNVKSSLPGQNNRHFEEYISDMNEKFCVLTKVSLVFVSKGPIDNNPALVQIMAWCRRGDKPLSEACWLMLDIFSIFNVYANCAFCLRQLYPWYFTGYIARGICAAMPELNIFHSYISVLYFISYLEYNPRSCCYNINFTNWRNTVLLPIEKPTSIWRKIPTLE